MRVIVPVAGSGTRLRPHTYTLPKPLLSVAGRPIIDHVLAPLDGLQVDEVVFVIGHMGELVREHVESQDRYPTRFVHQDKLLGLGYAVWIALRGIEDGPVLVVLGDTIVDCDLGAFTSSEHNVLGVKVVDDPHRFGIAEVENGFVTSLEEKPEKPRSNLALIGLYYFQSAAMLRGQLDRLVDSGTMTRGEFQLTDALAAMLDDGERFAVHQIEHWYDCGQKNTMIETNRHLLKRDHSSPPAGTNELIPPVWIDPSAKVANSKIGPYVAIDANAEVHDCELVDTLVGYGARVSGSKLRESLIGPKARISGGQGVVDIGDSSHLELE